MLPGSTPGDPDPALSRYLPNLRAGDRRETGKHGGFSGLQRAAGGGK